MHSDGDVESLVKFHSPSARPTVALPAAGEKKAGKRKTAKAYDKAQKRGAYQPSGTPWNDGGRSFFTKEHLAV